MKRTIYLLLAAFLLVLPAHAQDIGLTTLVIDPGHGGKDPGTVSRDGKYYEKTFTLDISKKLAEKIKAECPGVKVILTRDSDKTVALNDRAEIANKADAQLFMSIHINAVPSTGPNGFSVHVLGKSSQKDRDLFAYNMNVCKRENSVILLEDDYTTKYQGFDPNDPESFIFMQLMQNSHLEQSLEFAGIISKSLDGGPVSANRGVWQDPFLVLWRTAMPAVLVELGFISNATDLSVLKNESNRDKLAARLCEAFKKYKDGYDRSVALDVEVEAPSKPSKPADAPVAAGKGNVQESGNAAVSYGVQIFAGSKKLDPKDKAFMGYTPLIVNTGKVYKYIIAVSPDVDGAKKDFANIRKKYPDAFIVKIEGEKVTMQK
ncbi:MAG: N-acetylmuramoyl-L-alanine amidase [Bacteroidales bacterium]|nr:N-acetylmuramoyl-L-alanine amidase [Bacteroidales bacterium]